MLNEDIQTSAILEQIDDYIVPPRLGALVLTEQAARPASTSGNVYQ